MTTNNANFHDFDKNTFKNNPNTRIVFIGGGNMATAIFIRIADAIIADTKNTDRRIADARIADANLTSGTSMADIATEIIVIEHNPDRLQLLLDTYANYKNIAFYLTLNFCTTPDDLIIIAIKPQNALLSLAQIKHKIQQSIIISIMAGVSVKSIAQCLKNEKIVRIMPNTPAIVNLGVTGIFFSEPITLLKRKFIMDIFKLIGIIYLAKDEDDINKITAVSGSAPAYFYYFIESMLKVAISDFNFSELEAKNIILQVAKGSIALIEQNKEIPIDTLRQNVTSKGGTTQMAIAELINNGFAQIIQKAMHACYKKAEELSLDQ